MKNRLFCIACAMLAGLLAWLHLMAGLGAAGAAWAEEVPSAVASPPSAASSTGETPTPPAKRYLFRQNHDAHGIGKFYLGREIAQVMSFHGAPWLERAEREEEERLSILVDLLGLKPGDQAADIGAGSGVITVLMAKAVQPEGKVFAVDIQPEMLTLLGGKLSHLDVTNVELVLGTEKSPQLSSQSIDLALMVDVYHEFEFPHEMLEALSAALKPGGRLVFVEYRKEDPDVPIKLIHKMSEAQVRKEVEQPAFGLAWKETIAKLPRQHVIVFERQPRDQNGPGNPNEAGQSSDETTSKPRE